jgi:hypothetical protein
MKSRFFIAAFFLLASSSMMAQTLSEFKPKDDAYGINKARNAKRIYIAGFEVNYQIYNEKQDYKQGGSMMGGGMRGDAMAEVSVGLEGLDEKTVQEITDKLYKEYMAKIQAKGLTVITADEAGKIDTYSDYERIQGGKVSLAQIPGVMTSTPTGFEYFVKGTKKDGKEKTGGFLGNQAMMFPKLSKELDDAIIGNVDITVLFIQDGNGFTGSGAKVKVKTSLRVIATEGLTMASDAKIKMKGQNTVTTVTSTVGFYHGKMGAGATTAYVGSLGKPLFISGVLDEQKIVSASTGGMTAGTTTMYGTFYSARNGNNKNAKVVQVDAAKYSEGVYAATSKFLAHHTDAFLAKL